VLIIRGDEVRRLLQGRDEEILQAVAAAYSAHASGQSSVPPSLFLRFPRDPSSRIIALPAYLGGEWDVAGMKWISSFPANLETGLERASAVTILNSTRTGHPEAILEGSLISAVRTAAGAVLAARTLGSDETRSVGVIGCGLINFHVVRLLCATRPALARVALYDVDRGRAEQLGRRLSADFPELSVSMAGHCDSALEGHPLVSIATTASTPHIGDLSRCRPGAVILHVSLRDIAPEAIMAADNVVDDVDHVCRAQTSVHLAAELAGQRAFIRCTLGEILLGSAPARTGDPRPAVFSPFGLGILDLAVACLVVERARAERAGLEIEDFLSSSWLSVEAQDRAVPEVI
jgi:N-[(2S)-2-amino-2-carboxyethyl]-L-glutamate dehydrogenase